MIKYTGYQIVFREIPDEITLAINISGCPNKCPGCHSKELWEDVGEELTIVKLCNLIESNPGITCVCFMGGDQDPTYIYHLAVGLLTMTSYNLKIAWYSGKSDLPHFFKSTKRNWLRPFDFIKLGPYIESLGGLDSPKTNQRLYKVKNHCELIDITHKITKIKK